MEVVSKNLVCFQEDRVHQVLVYEACMIRKLGDHSGIPLLFGVCREWEPFASLSSSTGTGKTSNLFSEKSWCHL